MKKERLEYDPAYGCFFFCGLTALIISTIGAIPMDDNTAAGLGFLVAIPLAIASLVAMVVGIVLSIRIWEDWSLVILSGMSLLFVSEMLTEYGPIAFYNAVPFVYGIGVVAISGAWFLVRRKSRFPQL